LKEATVKVVVEQGHFIYTYPPEAFFAYVKVAFVAGFFLVSPFVFYELWGFVAPGLYEHERKWMIPVALLSAIFFVSGALFGYFIVFPFGFEFFASYANEAISFMPKLSEYLSFALKLLFAFGLIFEMPLFVFFLSRFGLVTSRMLRKQRKYAILVAFIVAAVLTPPDPFTQCLMAGPLVILSEISIWVAFFFGKEKTKREEEAAAAAEAEETPADGGGAGA
ncbi:MAG: twin-arginine translocase subunit TatC, partial [Desulfovibrionaceae bacterium]